VGLLILAASLFDHGPVQSLGDLAVLAIAVLGTVVLWMAVAITSAWNEVAYWLTVLLQAGLWLVATWWLWLAVWGPMGVMTCDQPDSATSACPSGTLTVQLVALLVVSAGLVFLVLPVSRRAALRVRG
jgi:hypothetical protein